MPWKKMICISEQLNKIFQKKIGKKSMKELTVYDYYCWNLRGHSGREDKSIKIVRSDDFDVNHIQQMAEDQRTENYLEILKKSKKAYFFPGTTFDRKLFKNLYPHLKVTKKVENADFVIVSLSDNFKLKSRTCYGYLSNDENVIHYNQNKLKGNGQHVAWRYYLYGDVQKVEEMFKLNKPIITTQEIFESGTSEVREMTLTEQKMKDLLKQCASRNNTLQKLACDIICSLDPEKYASYQYLAMCALRCAAFNNAKLLTLDSTIFDSIRKVHIYFYDKSSVPIGEMMQVFLSNPHVFKNQEDIAGTLNILLDRLYDNMKNVQIPVKYRIDLIPLEQQDTNDVQNDIKEHVQNYAEKELATNQEEEYDWGI